MVISAVLIYGASGARDVEAGAAEALAKPACTAPSVITTAGKFCGVTKTVRNGGKTTSVHAYLGMRYGFAQRFAVSKPVTATGQVRATLLGNVCPQSNLPANAPVSEDCLYLNVWVPAEPVSTPLPVLLFIHGGGFDEGASSQAVFMGTRLAAKGQAMIVTINYRLGALGFLGGGTGVNQIPPNLGLGDQQLAMSWVHDNAATFGGNPARIALFGESAGAMSIGAHLTSASSAPLFHSAIMESNPYGIPFKNVEQANAVRTAFDSTPVVQGCPASKPPGTLACLKALTWQQLLEAQAAVGPADLGLVLSGQFTGLLTWAPQIDGKLVPIQPNEAQITKPVIAGTNRNEGSLFITLPAPLPPGPPFGYLGYVTGLFGANDAKRIIALPRYRPLPKDNRPQLSKIVNDYLFTCATRHVLSASKGRAYSYLFAHKPSFAVWPGPEIPTPCQPVADGGQGQVCHSFELPYVFRNPVAVNTPATPTGGVPPGDSFTAVERPLIDWITEYWTSFAANGRPSASSVATPWPPFRTNGTRQVLNLNITQTRDTALNCAFWDQIGYDKGANLFQFSNEPL